MLFLIYGKGGWISSMIVKELERQGLSYVISDIRVDNIKDMRDELDRIRPSHCICLIGRTSGPGYNSIDFLEDKPYINIRDNLFAPISLALECQRRNIHMTYLGTGCIFTYRENNIIQKEPLLFDLNQIFNEEDEPNFFGSQYSVVKGFTDRLMHEIPSCLNLRIRMPISSQPHKRNFIDKIVSYKKICSIPNSMTVLDDFIPIIIDMSSKGITGTFNLCNPGVITHNEILELYKKYVDINHTWENFTIEEQDKILKAGRSNNHLDTSKIEALYHIDDIKTSVEKVIMKMSIERVD